MKKNKKKKLLLSSLICVIIFVITVLTINPILNNLKFGLDLQGGFEVLYQVKPIEGSLTEDMLTSTYKTISRRIDVLGVSEPSIIVEGTDRIRVGLAGVTDKEEARKILGKQATLTFRDASDNLLMTSDVLKSGGARVTTNEKGLPAVSLQINDKEKFYEVTNRISKEEKNLIVIWLDYEEGDSFSNEQYLCGSDESNCLSAASVSQGFASDVIIEGNFTEKEVKNLVDLINSGSLPTKLEEISSKTVGAEFGENSLSKTLTSGVIGIAIIMLFMVIVYRFAGLIACLGISLYTYTTFLLFYLIGGVLTLPGVAALVIGIGMAVDTCVINFARIKDELKKGSSLKAAYKKGNKNSLLTIIDANLTTLLVAIILFIFGESSIKGFATMLIISIFVTLIVMLYITRWILNIFVETNFFDDKLNLFIGLSKKEKKEHEFNFVKFGKKYSIFAIIFVVVGIISLFVFKLNLGLEFKGGTSINVISSNEITEENIKNDLQELEYNLIEIEKIEDKNYIITISDVLDAEKVANTEKHFKDKYVANTEIGVISNLVKKDLIINAFKSLIYALIGIILYVSIRFKFSYAISGLLALFLDVFAMVTLFSIFKLEVSSIFIAAILSIVGYSINDTIVTFDRVREYITKKNKKLKDEELEEITNLSLKETVMRSIITTITTLIPTICLIIFGSHEIMNFNIALLIGLINGSLSSLFFAPIIWLILTKREMKKPKTKKWYEIDEKEEKSIKGINS